MTKKNVCVADVADAEPKQRRLLYDVVLGGNDGNGAALVRVRGSCQYTAKGDPEVGFGGGIEPGWRCESKVYTLDIAVAAGDVALPELEAEDIRGLSGAESWYGKKPPLRLESAGEAVLDEFPIDGDGQLRFSCPKGIANDGNYYSMDSCLVSWRNTAMPEKIYFHGTCGETVTVPGLYVARGR